MSEKLSLATLVSSAGPVRINIVARLSIVGGKDRFRPTGYPDVGIVIYKAPRDGGVESVCAVDSAASMANHLESMGMRGPLDCEIAPELEGIPYMRWFAEAKNDPNGYEYAGTTLNESHRMGSPTFYGAKSRIMKDGKPQEISIIEDMEKVCNLRSIASKNSKDKKNGKEAKRKSKGKETQVKENGEDTDNEKAAPSRYHVMPEAYWHVLKYIMTHDPNTLVHGGMFTRMTSMKLSRLISSEIAASGASKVSTSGVKFDLTGITDSGQAIFSVDDVTAREIKASFLIDVAQLRSYGTTKRLPGSKTTDTLGLTDEDKKLVLAICFWKVGKLLQNAHRYRSNCDLKCDLIQITMDEGEPIEVQASELTALLTKSLIADCKFPENPVTDVFLPFVEALKEKKKDEVKDTPSSNEEDEPDSDESEIGGP